MNALTKAFVVVVTILAVILVALVVPFAANVPNYAQQHKDMKLAYQAQVNAASDERAAWITEKAAMGTALKAEKDLNRQLQTELTVSGNKVTELRTQLTKSQTTLAGSISAQEVLSRTNEEKDDRITGMADVIQNQLGTLAEIQSQNADLSKTVITANAEVRRLSNNYLRIQEENKALVQKQLEAQAMIEVLSTRLAALGEDPTKDPGPIGGPLIKGSVVTVNQATGGLTFVEINVGTRDKVKEGMEFTVSRGDEFLGTVKITNVDTAAAVGQLTLGGGLKSGDAVRTGGR